MCTRVSAGLDVLRGEPLCDPSRVAAIGYCFGGTCVLELARSGADVAGVVSFHGGLATANPADAKNIRGKVLVLHGGDDPHVSPKEVAAFEEETRSAGVDWQLVVSPKGKRAWHTSKWRDPVPEGRLRIAQRFIAGTEIRQRLVKSRRDV